MFELLGAHINGAGGDISRTLAEWKPPLIVSIDHSEAWHEVKAISPKTTIIGRLITDGEYSPTNEDEDPTLAAREHCEKVLPFAERMGRTYSFWQGINEPVVPDKEAMNRLAEFECERVMYMSARGFNVVVGSFSVGNPRISYWREFLPALEAAKEHDGALALHEYAWPEVHYAPDWYILRHRKVYDGNSDGDPADKWEGLPKHLKTLPLYVTESGLDGLIEDYSEPRGWQTVYGGTPILYTSQLETYNKWLLEDMYVMGSAVYCMNCGGEWETYNIHPTITKAIVATATPIYRRYLLGTSKTILKWALFKVVDMGTEEVEIGIDSLDRLYELAEDHGGILSIDVTGDDTIVYVQG